ncbi:hypothetical protein DFH09DRAFT_1270161 [Mycena vulgaris]|nr:hypothetical protein DFH09DRAFT_1270161 [Mycena vulgaris]
MENIQQRAGFLRIRVGGSTQEGAKLVDSFPDNHIIQKNMTGIASTMNTPPLDFTRDLLYMMRNISSFVNAGNKPDMYVLRSHRDHIPFDYGGEMSDLLAQLDSSGADINGRAKRLLIGPPQLSLEASGSVFVPQDIYKDLLTHDGHVNILAPYLASTAFAQTKGKPFLMMETNMASCGGVMDGTLEFLWRILPPAFPIYGLYENGKPMRVAAFNYVDDLTGASDVDVVISIAGGPTPAQVKVKYLAAKTVSQKGGYTWAGQTFGGFFESDGCLMGVEDIKTVQCYTTASAQTCTVKVPTPDFALIFLTDTVYSEADTSTLTFPTTARTKTQNTATVDPSVLATSNGHSAGLDGLGSTSKGGNKSAGRCVYVPVLLAGLGMGAALLYHRIQSLYFGAQLHSSFFASFHRIRRL